MNSFNLLFVTKISLVHIVDLPLLHLNLLPLDSLHSCFMLFSFVSELFFQIGDLGLS
jgi:hypothetical protein